MDSAARPIVLVAGACLGGWAWQEVAGRLAGQGHSVYPVTLTGLGERVHLADRGVDLETHIADVVNLLDFEALEDAILVGHSYAGIVITAVADRRPQRLEAVVYLDTAPFPDGVAIVDVQTPEQRERQQREVTLGGEGWQWPVPDVPTLRSGVYGSASGLTASHLQLLRERATPHPYATFTSPLRLSAASPPAVRRVAILCAAGGTDLETLRRLIAEDDPRGAAFAGGDWELHELATGHWPMFSLPGPLGDLLHELGSG
jgi:pimeloyl-ACP methyl ester carboxylesterase